MNKRRPGFTILYAVIIVVVIMIVGQILDMIDDMVVNVQRSTRSLQIDADRDNLRSIIDSYTAQKEIMRTRKENEAE